MNKIYKVIYNKNKHRYEVVSELAKSHGGKCKTTVVTAGDTNWLRRLWMRVRGGVNKRDEDGNPVTMSISRAAMVALMCISVWSAAAVSSSWVEAASTDVSVKYDETTKSFTFVTKAQGSDEETVLATYPVVDVFAKYDEAADTIKVVKTDPSSNEETVLATHPVVDVSAEYDERTGTIKIVKTDPRTNDKTILATYAVGGNITPITGDKEGQYPTNTIALGQNSTVLQSNTIAIGTDAHAGNVGGSDDTNGRIAIGTKTVASGDRSIALGNFSTENGGSYNIVQGRDSIGIGTSTSVFGYSGVSIGRRNIIGVPDPDLVKDGVLTTKSRTKYSENDLGGNSVIVGAYNVAYGNRSNVIGTYSRAMGNNSVAIGSGVQSLSDGAIAIGKGSGYEFNNKDTKSARYWELPPEYKVLKQVLKNDIKGDKVYTKSRKNLPKYENYGAGSSDPGGFIVEGKNALGIGTYTQVRGDSAIGLATGEMTADLSDKDKSAYAKDMKKIMEMEETLYDAKEALQAGATTNDPAALQQAVKTAEESLAAAKKNFRETYLTKYSFVDGDGALGVGRQILAQGDRSMAVGDFAKAISSDAIAYGGQTLANGTNSMAIGGKAHVGTTDTSFDNSMAIGSHTNVQAGNAVALGAFSEVTGENSLALGFGKQSDNNTAYNSVSGKDSTLIGSYGTVKGNNSILIGSSGNIANDRVVGLGNNINIAEADPNDQENNTAGSVFLGDHAGYVKDSKRSRSLGQVDVVGSAGKMELTESLSSTKGALRDYTKDFIYIYMLERQDDGTQIGAPIAVRSDFAGGDSTVGVVSVGSTYEQNFNSLEDIKNYHTKVGSLITVPVEVTVQVTKNGVPLGEQKQIRYFAADSTYDEIYADNTLKDEDKAKVWKEIQTKTSTPNTTYTVFETRRIQNVAPGLIGLNSTDAINGSQLFATNQMLGNLVGSLKKTLGDNVTVTEDGEITVAGDIKTLGWIAKADTVDGSNGKVAYDVDKEKGETEEAYQARIAKLKKDGYVVDASKVMTFKAGKNIELVQKPGEFSISTIDTPSFKSVELRGDETKDVDGNKVTPVTMLDSNGMQVYTETVTSDGDGTTTTKKVSTTVNNEGVTTDGTVKVTNGKDGGDAKDLVTIGKEVNSDAAPGTDGENGTIGLNGKNGSEAVITIDRGTKSLTNDKNIALDPTKPVGETNPMSMDRITYTTKGADGSTINHEVATLDDGFFLTTSKDVKDKKAPAGVKLNHTITFTDGANTKVSAVTSDNNGVHSLHIDVNGLPVVYTDKDGNKLTKVGDKFYKDDQFDNGTLKPNATPSDAKNISIVNPDGSISKTDGSAPTTVNNVGSSIGGDVNNGAPTGSTINGERGTNSFIDKLNKVGSTENDAISKNAVVTTGDLKNLADTPLFFSGDAADGKNGNVKNTFGRKLSEEAKIVGGVTIPANLTDNNIGVVSNGSDTLTVKLAKNLKDLDSTTYTSDTTATGDAKSSMKVDGNGVRFVNANGDTVSNTPTFTTDGITGGNKTITDVASGIGGEVKDAAHDNANTFLENVNKIGKEEGGQPAADAISENVVVNAKDLKNLVDTGFKLNTSGQPTKLGASTVKIGDTINIIDGANTKVSAIDDSTTGTHTFHIDVTGMPISYTDNQGNALTKIGDNYYKNTDIEDGKPKDNAVAVPADKVTNNVKVVNKDGGTTEQGSIGNVKSVFDSTIGNGGDTGSQIDGINDANKVEKVPGTNQFIKDLTTLKGDTPADKEKLNSVSTVGDLQKVALTPLFFEGDTADGKTGTDGKPHKNTFGRKLSETAKIIGGQTDVTKLTDGNIGVVSNGSDTLTIKLAKELKDLDSVKVSNGKDGDDAKDLVTIGKEVNSDAAPGTDGENGTIGLNGKNGSEAVITIDRGTKSLTDAANVGTNREQEIGANNPVAGMDRITYTTKGPNNSTINHEVATLDDGFFLTTSKDVANKKAAAGVKLNDTIQFNDGINTKVSTVTSEKGVHELHIDVSGLPVSYTDNDGDAVTKIGDKYYKSNQVVDGKPIDGATEVPADQVTNNIKVVNTDGTTNTPGTISNVASGIGGKVVDPDHNDSNTFLENVNKVGATTDGISENVVVNAKDLKNLVDTGFKLNTSGQPTDSGATTVKIGETINVINGVNTKVSAIDDTVEGTHTFHIDVTGMPISYTDTDGNALTKIGDDYYKNTDITNGVPNKDAVAVDPEKVTDNIKVINKDGSTTNPGTISNVKSAIDGVVGNGAPKGSTINGEGGTNTFIDNVNRIGADTNGIDKNSVVTTGDLKNLADTSLFFSGDAADGKEYNGATNTKNTFGRKLSEEAKIVGGVTAPANLTDNNIGVVSNGSDTLTIKLAKQLTGLDSATYTSPTTKTDDGDATSTMKVDGNGIRFVGDNNAVKTDAPSLTTDGITGGSKQITNVGSGFKNGDKTISISDLKDPNKVPSTSPVLNNAVNVGDLKNIIDTGFKLNTSGQPADPGASTVKIGDTINIIDGANTKVSAIDDSKTGTYTFHIDVTGLPVTYTAKEGENGQPVDVSKVGDTYQLADGTKLVKYGNKFYKPNQIVNGQPVGDAQGFTINDDIRLVNPNNGTGPMKITNVAPGVGDNDAVNMSQLKTLSAGSKTEVTGTGAAEVTKKTAKDGHDIYNVHVDKLLTVKPMTPGTPMERGADGKYYAPSEIQDKTFVSDGNGGGSWYAKDDVDKYGTPLDGKSPLAQQPKELDQNELKTSVTNPNGTGPTIVDNVKSVLDGSGIGNGADMSSTIDAIENGKRVDKAGSNQFIKDLTGLDPDTDANKLNSVSTVSDLQKVALTPLFFEGDTAESATTKNAFGRKLSEKAKIVGGQKDVTKLTDNNIGVVSNGSDTLTIKLAKELQDLTSVTTADETNGTKTTVSGKGITTDGKVVVNNGKTGDEAKEFVTIEKGTDGSGTDKEYGKIGLDGKNGSNATITIDRGTKSLNDDVNIGVDPSQPVSETNKSTAMDRITYTTTGPNKTVINHEVATLDDGFFLTTSKDVTDNKAAAKVKLNNTIKFTDGANTKVSTVDSKKGIHELHVDVTGLPVTYTASELDDNGKPTNTQNVSKVGDTYQLEDGTKLVKVDGKYYKPDQLDNGTPKPGVKGLTIDNSIRVINPEQPNSTAKITNVAPGEEDTDAVNMSQLKQKVAAATTEVTGTGAAEVTKVKGADGQNIYNVHVDKLMTVKPVDTNTNITRGGDGKYYNADDIAGKTFVPSENKWYNTADVDANTGKPLTGKTPLDKQPTAVEQNTLKNSLVNPNGNDSTVLDNVKSGIGGKVVDPKHENKNTFIENLDKVGKPANEGGIDNTTVVNAGDLKNLADTPLFFSGDSADGEVAADGTDKNTFSRKLSQETKIVGGVELGVADTATATERKEAIAAKLTDGNIGVISDGTDTLTIKLAKNLQDLDAVKVSNGKDGKEGKDLVTIGKEVDTKAPAGKDGENGIIGLDGKNGSEAVITIDRGTKSITDEANVGKDPNQPVSGTNKSANMDRITYTTKGANGDINHEVATLDDGFMLTTSTDVANSKAPANVKLNNTIKFTDGANTKVSTVTSKDGVHELHVDVSGLPMTYVDKDGKPLTKIGDKFYKSEDLDANGVPKPNTTPVADNNVTSNVTMLDKNGNTNTAPQINNVGDGLKNGNTDISVSDLKDATKVPVNSPVWNHAVNVNDLKKVIDAGFKLNTSGQQAATSAATVAIGDTINVIDGANTKVSAITSAADGTHTFHIDVTGLPMTYTAAQFDGDGKVVDGSTVNVSKVGDTYQTEDGTKLVNVGGKYYKPNQLDSNGQPKDGEQGLTVTNSISLQNPNSADDPATLKNVGSGLVDKNGKPVSIDEAVGTNAVNVNDLRKMGSAAKTEVKGTGAAEVTKLTADDGHEIYNVHVDKLMKVTAVTPNTDVTRGGDGKYYKAGDIVDKTFVSDGNGGGDWYNSTDVDEKTGKPLDGKNPLPSDQTPQPMKQSDLKNSIVNPNGDGPTVVDNVKSVLDSASIGNGGADSSTIDGVGGNNEFIKQLTGLNPATAADKAKLNSVATVGDLQKVALTPLFFEGDSADGVPATDGTDKNTFGRKLSEKAKIVGGVDLGLQGTVTTEQRKQAIADKLTDKNIGVISNGSDTLTIKLAKDLTGLNSSVYTSLTPAGNDGDATSSMKLDGNGIRFIDGQGKAKTDAPSLTTDGIKGGNKQITDVADGLKNGDTIVSIDDLRNPSKSLKDSSVWTNAVNVNDLKKLVDAGFKLNTSGQGNAGASTVKIGDTINVVDGANTKVSAITSADDGTHTFHIDVTGLPVTYTATKTDANGAPTGEPVDVSKVGDGYQLADGTKLVKAGDKYYTPDQLENGKPKPDAEGLTIKESVSLTQDNSAPATLERVGSGRRNGMDASEKPMDWNTILNPTGENEDKVNNMLTNAANIGDVRDAMQSVTEAGKGGGFGLTGNNGTVTQDLGKTITVKGGIANAVDEKTGDDLNTPEKSTTDKNTYVNVKDITGADGTTSKEMVVEIAKDLTDLDSVTVGEVGADGNTDGVTKITKDGMNTKVVENGKTKSTDVSADGVTVTDADGRTNTSTATKNELVDGKNKNTSTATKNELTDGDNTNTSTATENKLTDKDGNTNTSTSTETKLSDKEGDKTTSIKAGDMTVSKKNDKGETGSTHVDGGTITLENKDKDGKALDAKTELSNKGMTITPVDKKGNPIDGKKVSLSDKGLNNGGNQIINVDSGLKNDKGQKVDINDIKDDDSMLNNAVNVGDLKEAMNKAKTEVGGSGAADVIPGTGKDGNPKYTVHVDKLVEAKADDGKAIVRGEDNKFYYKDESLKQGKDGKWYPKDKLDADGNPEAGAVGKNIPILGTDPVPADNLKTSLVNPNDPNSKVKLDNIKSAIGGDVGNGAGSEDKVNGVGGTNSFIDNLDKVGKKDADGNLASDGIADDAAVTTGDLKNLADTPLFFGGDSADGESTDGKEHTNTFDRKLGKQINIKGEVDLGLGDNATAEERKTAIKEKLSDGNIGVISNGKDTLTVKLSKDLKDLNTIEVNDSVSVGKDGDSTVIKGSETTSSFTEVATGPDGQPLYEVDKNGEVVRDANGDPIPVTKTSSTTTGGGKLATDVERVEMVDGKPVTSHETTTIDGSHFESKDKDGNYTTINGGEIKSYDKDTNGSVTIKGDSLTASSKDENGHDKVTNISSDGFNSTATTFERDGNGQLVLNPDTGLPKEVTNKTNINSDGFTATRTDSEGNEVLKTTMQNGNIAIEKPQPIIDPTTGEAYKVLDKNGNWVPAHGYTKISDNGFEIQGINQSGTGISKVRLSSEGLDNGGNRITHVAEGIAPDDAVNVSQLRDLTQNINNDIANVGANAAALAGLKAIQYDPLEPTQIMAAVGTYRGKQAAALGIAHYKNEDTMFHMGVSIGSDHTMANIGVTYKFGRTDEKKAVPDRYKAGPISSTYVLQDEMVALKEENARMRANDEKMNAAYDEILNLVKQLKQDNEEMKKKLEKLEKK